MMHKPLFRSTVGIISICSAWLMAGLPTAFAVQPPAHWQEGMATGVVMLSGTLSVQHPMWVWSDYSSADVRLRPTRTSQGMAYGMSTSDVLPVLAGHTETLLSPKYLTLRPEVTLGVTSRKNAATNAKWMRVTVQGVSVNGQRHTGEMTFRVRHLLACQDRQMALSGMGWRLLSASSIPAGTPGLSAPLTLDLNTQFLNVMGYDYPLHASGLPMPETSVVMSCQFPATLSGPAEHPDILGQGIAGVSLTVLDTVRFHFPDVEGAITRWQAKLVPEVSYL